jgi:hypothetical protein
MRSSIAGEVHLRQEGLLVIVLSQGEQTKAVLGIKR